MYTICSPFAMGILDMPYPLRYVPEIREPNPDCNRAVEGYPGRLWSRWEIMRSFYASWPAPGLDDTRLS
jgi:hypothetical protein